MTGDDLGLSAETEQADGSRIYGCGATTMLHVYPAPDSACGTAGTIATWDTADLEPLVDELKRPRGDVRALRLSLRSHPGDSGRLGGLALRPRRQHVRHRGVARIA